MSAEIHIVGYGPSVSKEISSALAGKFVIALNYAFELLPDADVIFFGNEPWFRLNWPKLRAHPARLMRVMFPNAKTLGLSEVLEWQTTGVEGLETEPGKLRHGKCCGYASINLAVQLGAKEIFLHGFDMRPGGKHARHDATNFYPEYAKRFDTYIAPLTALGVRVWNLSPESTIKAFPTKSCTST